MPTRCCVKSCRAGYKLLKKEKKNVPVFKLPSDVQQCQRWMNVLKAVNGEDFKATHSTVVCELHWPDGYEKCRQHRSRNKKPLHPPSVFPEFTTSGGVLPTESIDSENNDYSYDAKLSFDEIREGLLNYKEAFMQNLVTFEMNDAVYCLSKKFFHGISTYLIVFHKDLKYEAFFHGVKVYISTLTKQHKCSVLDSSFKYLFE